MKAIWIALLEAQGYQVIEVPEDSPIRDMGEWQITNKSKERVVRQTDELEDVIAGRDPCGFRLYTK